MHNASNPFPKDVTMFFRPRLTGKFLVCAVAAGLAATFALYSSPAQARPEKAGQSAADRFNAMDADKDGKVTREEFFAAQPQMKEAAFLAIDADKDGVLTLEEWEGFSMGHAKDSKPGEGGMPGMGGSGMPPGMSMPPQGMGGSGGMKMPPQGKADAAPAGGGANGTEPVPGKDGPRKPDLIMPPSSK